MPEAADTIKVGNWVTRYRGKKGRNPLSRAHLVESTVSQRIVTRCGREMRVETFNGFSRGVSQSSFLRVADGINLMLAGRCEQCSR